MHMHTQGVGNIASPSCSTFRSSWQNCMSWEHLRLPRGLYRMYMQLIARLDHGYLTQLSPKVISCPHLTFKVRWRPPLTYFMWRVTTDRLKTADAKDEAKRGQLKRATERSQSPAPEAGSLDLRWDGWRAGRGPRIFSVSFENPGVRLRLGWDSASNASKYHRTTSAQRTTHNTFGAWQAFMSARTRL